MITLLTEPGLTMTEDLQKQLKIKKNNQAT